MVVTTTPSTQSCECLVAGRPGQGEPLWQNIGTSTSSSGCRTNCNNASFPPGASVLESRFDAGGTEITFERIPNDGIVPVASQQAYPITLNWHYPNRVNPAGELEGSNHFQVRSDRTTADVFKRAFQQPSEYRYFELKRR